MPNRIWNNNGARYPSTIISVSSEQLSNPASHLRDQQRQKTWRSKVGYTVTNDNNKIDFNRGGVKVATIANGYYLTQAEYGAAVVAAMEAADAVPQWDVDWNVATNNCFRLRDLLGNTFSLLFSSGANVVNSAGPDLGFDVFDFTGVSTYTATNESYQSRQFLRFNIVGDIATTGVPLCWALLQHNLTGPATARLQMNLTDSWAAPLLSTTMTAPLSDPAYQYFGPTQPRHWWRITVNNVSNSEGFTEVGIIYIGDYIEPVRCISIDHQMQSEPFTTTLEGIAGTRFHNIQPERFHWSIAWADLDPTDRLEVEEYYASVAVGRAHFFDFDPATAGELFYVTREGFGWQFVPFQYRKYATQLVEAV